jgi:hypothetical protein
MMSSVQSSNRHRPKLSIEIDATATCLESMAMSTVRLPTIFLATRRRVRAHVKRQWLTFDRRRFWILMKTNGLPFAVQLVLLAAFVTYATSELLGSVLAMPQSKRETANGFAVGFLVSMTSWFFFSMWSLLRDLIADWRTRGRRAATLWLTFTPGVGGTGRDDDAWIELQLFLVNEGRLRPEVVAGELEHLRASGRLGPESERALTTFMPPRFHAYSDFMRQDRSSVLGPVST